MKQPQILRSAANSIPEELSSGILKDNQWLNDEHIDHAQCLLMQKFPNCNGLNFVLAFQGRTPKVERGLVDFVQILNVGGNHWVTITNIGCHENRIRVYDSLIMKLSKKEKEEFHCSLAALLNTSHPNMIIEYPAMQKQRLFAVAVAFSLLAGDDPSQQSYDQKSMRAHLSLCFQVGDLAAFPQMQAVSRMQE